MLYTVFVYVNLNKMEFVAVTDSPLKADEIARGMFIRHHFSGEFKVTELEREGFQCDHYYAQGFPESVIVMKCPNGQISATYQ
jgi:hypothetical protein